MLSCTNTWQHNLHLINLHLLVCCRSTKVVVGSVVTLALQAKGANEGATNPSPAIIYLLGTQSLALRPALPGYWACCG